MLDFVAGFHSTVIGTLDENGFPFSSYAPFVYDDHRYYVFISDIAAHAGNLRREKKHRFFSSRMRPQPPTSLPASGYRCSARRPSFPGPARASKSSSSASAKLSPPR